MPTNIFRMIKDIAYLSHIQSTKLFLFIVLYSSTTEILLKLILHYKTNSKWQDVAAASKRHWQFKSEHHF